MICFGDRVAQAFREWLCFILWLSKQWPKGPSPQGALFGVTLPHSSGHMQFPIFAWPMAACVDVSKPSGLHSFSPCLRPDLMWALWKIQPFHFDTPPSPFLLISSF